MTKYESWKDLLCIHRKYLWGFYINICRVQYTVPKSSLMNLKLSDFHVNFFIFSNFIFQVLMILWFLYLFLQNVITYLLVVVKILHCFEFFEITMNFKIKVKEFILNIIDAQEFWKSLQVYIIVSNVIGHIFFVILN